MQSSLFLLIFNDLPICGRVVFLCGMEVPHQVRDDRMRVRDDRMRVRDDGWGKLIVNEIKDKVRWNREFEQH